MEEKTIWRVSATAYCSGCHTTYGNMWEKDFDAKVVAFDYEDAQSAVRLHLHERHSASYKKRLEHYSILFTENNSENNSVPDKGWFKSPDDFPDKDYWIRRREDFSCREVDIKWHNVQQTKKTVWV